MGNHKNVRKKARFLALLLAFVMVTGSLEPSFVMASGTENSLADETVPEVQAEVSGEASGNPEETIEAVEPTEETEVPEETTEAEEETGNPEVPKKTEETEEPTEETKEPEETTETEEPTEETTETEEPAEETTEEMKPEEDQLPREFTYEGEKVTIFAVVPSEAGLPEGTELKAEALAEDSKEYEAAFAAVEEALKLEENECLLFVPYEVYFTCEGEKVQPESPVHVEMSFSEPLFAGLPEELEVGEVFAAHVKDDGKAERLENVSEDENRIVFETESFSVMGPAAAARVNEIETYANEEEQAYAILYDSGEMVFQRGDVPDPTKGTVVGTYTGFETTAYARWNEVPWDSEKASIKSVTFKDVIHPISTAFWFFHCGILTSADVSKLDTSKVINMDSMFCGCYNLSSLDVSGWDTSAVTDMEYMFYECYNLSSPDVLNWDTSAVTDMNHMFYRCYEVDSLDVSKWNTSKVTNMNSMFYDCGRLSSLDVSGLDTSAVTNMSAMFSGCIGLSSLDMSDWNTGKVTNMNHMFNECSSLSSLDVSGWDTSAVTDMSYMFYSCNSLNSLDMSGWKTGKVTNMNHMFYDCSSLSSLDMSGLDTSAVTDMSYMFSNCYSLSSLNTSGWKTGKVTNMNRMFYMCSSFNSLDLTGLDTSAVTNMSYMFSDCSSLSSLDVSSWNTGKVTNMDHMFSSCSDLSSLDVSGWNTSNVKNMYYMFSSCTKLNSLNVSSWNTSAVTNMERMFYNCINLTSVDVSVWNTSAVTNMGRMFYNCMRLTSVDVSGWDASKVTYMDRMFRDCNALRTLTLGEKFRFAGYPILPSGSWMRVSTEEIYTSEQLDKNYDGSTMAGVYVKATDITFNPTGGSVTPNTMTGVIGMTVKELPVATKEDARFDGWYTKWVGGEKLEVGGKITQTTYYAHWIYSNYTLVLKSNGSEAEEITVPLSYTDFYSLSDKAFSREGYVLSGWNTRKNGTGTAYGANEIVTQLTKEDNGTVILYAQWKSMSDYVTIGFDTQGGNAMEALVLKSGAALGIISDPVREDHTFMAWHKDSPTGEKVTSETTVTEDMTLFAEWKENPVVTFDGRGVADNIERRVRYNATVGTLPKFPTNSHRYQTLIGWFTKETGGTQITSSTKVTKDVTFYAHWGWQPKFNTNGGKLTGNTSYPIQEDSQYTIENLPVAVRDGYRLTGWYLTDGVTEVHDGAVINLEKDIEIVAHWEPLSTVTVTLDPNGGKINDSTEEKTIELYQGSNLTGLYVPVRTNYRFLRWEDSEGRIYDESSVISGDITLTARWEAMECTVTFDPGEGTMYQSARTKTVPAGGTIQTLPGAKQAGYIFDGWYPETGGQGEKLTTNTVISENVTYYAHYTPMMAEGTDESFRYIFGAEWSNASNQDVDNVNNNLEFHPTTNETQTATLHIRFELNQSVGENTLPKEAVKIRIPKYVWKDWEKNSTGGNDLSKQLPKYPDIGSNMFFSYIEEEDSYLLVNNRPLSGGAGLDVKVSYTVNPWKVPGGAVDENGDYVEGYEFYKGTVPVTVTVDKDLDNTPETNVQKDLTLEMHTRVEEEPRKSLSKVYYQWPSAWGEAPADAEDYFYIAWGLSADYNSSVNQPYSFVWSEDTVHDGTVAFWLNEYGLKEDPVVRQASSGGSRLYSEDVILKYPIELLKDIPEEGLTLHNEAILETRWKSGYTTKQRVNASAVVFYQEYSKGEFDKYNDNSYVHSINGGQEDILDDHKEVPMSWNLTYGGNSRNTPVVWNEDTGNYTADMRTIELTDGVSGDLMYSSGRASKPYVWEPESENIPLSDEDYYFTLLNIKLTEQDAGQSNGIWGEPYTHTDVADYNGVDIYVRYQHTDAFVFYKTVYVTHPGSDLDVSLPEDVVGFKVLHDTDFYATELNVKCYAKIKPTNWVQALVQADVNDNTTSLFKNRAVCSIWNADDPGKEPFFHMTNDMGGQNGAARVIHELNVSRTSQYTRKLTGSKEKTVIDAGKGVQDTPVYIVGWNYNNSRRLKQIKTGVFYDLLPAGTTVDESTIFGIPKTDNTSSISGDYADSYESYQDDSSRLNKALYDVRFEPDWQGSGRTMMIIRYAAPEGVKATGMQFWYLLHNTYENITENGTTVENDVAFVNTTEGAVIPYSRNESQSTITEKQYYDELQAEHADFISYYKASTHYVPVNAYSWGVQKDVRTSQDYKHSAATIPNQEYTYRLTYSQSSNAQSSGIVFYDVLEYGAMRKGENGEDSLMLSEWHGVFKGIDVSDVSEKVSGGTGSVQCNPVIYYSTKDRGSFVGEDYDVTNTKVWSLEKPEDASFITAVAIDCSKNTDGTDFVLKGKDSMAVYITMTSPAGEEFYNKTAYNEVVVYSKRNDEETPTSQRSDSDVTLTDERPELHKTSDPKSGTEEKPAPVHEDEELSYTISVKNVNEAFTLHDIIVEDTVPEKLNIDTENIKVHFGDASKAVKVSLSPRVSLSKTGQKLKFTVSSLMAGETIYLVIPTIVMGKEGVLENTAVITSINGVEKELRSETTYHEIKPEPVRVSVDKTVAGSMGDKTKDFHFRLKLSGDMKLPTELPYVKGDDTGTIVLDAEHAAEFTLAHGETIVFDEIPKGASYEVTETAVEGYVTEAVNASGVLEKDVNVSFTNTKNGVIPTSAHTNYGVLAGIAVFAAAGVLWILYRRRKPE